MTTTTRLFTFILMIVWFGACSAVSSSSGLATDNTGDTGLDSGGSEPLALPPTIAKLSPHMNTVADVLIPEVSSEGANQDVSYLLDYADADLWSSYLTGENYHVIGNIFGPEDEGDAVITKIRVLLAQFERNLSGILVGDSDVSCSGSLGSQATVSNLNEDGTIPIAFYGEIENGSEGNRYYQCFRFEENVEQDDSGTYNTAMTSLYGLDDDNVFRVVFMEDISVSIENEQLVEERGSAEKIRQVAMAVYAEGESDAGVLGYLDLQYNQATTYIGPDETWYSDDDVAFKSRTRITGSAVIDDDDQASLGRGDFMVVSYAKGIDNGGPYTNLTQAIGRGGYDVGDESLFAIDSTIFDSDGALEFFCLEHTGASVPAYTEEAGCESHETTFAWEGDFLFDLSPDIETGFADKVLFTVDDLISDDGSDFVVEDYQ